eukprot:COSAG01_NODE_4684_length_4814_cov_11.714952_2_plen_215_part_00
MVLHLLDHGSTTTTQGDGTTTTMQFHETLFVPLSRRDANEIAHGEYGHELHGDVGQQLSFDQRDFEVAIQPDCLPLSESGDIQLAIRSGGADKEAVMFLDIFGCSDSDRFDRARRLVDAVLRDLESGGPSKAQGDKGQANQATAKKRSADDEAGSGSEDEDEEEKPPIYWCFHPVHSAVLICPLLQMTALPLVFSSGTSLRSGKTAGNLHFRRR